ncbi:MAG: Npun_F5749 family FMN-dependent PPOX-type flavoprotein [Phormidesmis sp.]
MSPLEPLEKIISEDLAPWRSPLSRAVHRNRAVAFSRFVQLATVRADGTPANRTVVFRGFLESTNQLMFVSDRRSEKTAQIQQNPNAEACWYFTKTREQFRLAGQLRLITVETEPNDWAEARQRLWQKLSQSARLQFAWPQPKASRADSAAFDSPAPDEHSPPPTFSALCLAVEQVDHLELRGEPQSRYLYTKAANGQWNTATVNP